MSIAEMKKAIGEKVNQLNEEQLKKLSIFINKINNVQPNEWELKDHINIVNERATVLKKLAQ